MKSDERRYSQPPDAAKAVNLRKNAFPQASLTEGGGTAEP